LERFDPARVLATIEDNRATIFMGVPTFYRRFLEAGPSHDVSSVRLFTSGSAPLPAAVHTAFQDAFGHQILERYGMTEIGIVLSNPYEGVRKPGTVGLPLPGVRCRIVVPDTDDDIPKGEVGEVLISGPSVFDGYLGRPDATARALRDGWMHTGDLGRFDEDGYVALQGRRNDLILVGGFNVYPLEVESVLRMLPGVVDVAVVGIPHDDLGEVAVAAIVADHQLPTDAAIQAHLQAHLAGYKVPRQVRRVDALPRNAMGKVQKTRIRATW
jgi:malonyl-CoA/methylmalonyl-CoA synthetase